MRKHKSVAIEFGITLKTLRLEKGLTQEKLGFEARIDRSFIAMIEGGKHSPSIDTAYSLAQGLGISFTDLARILEVNLGKANEKEHND